MPGLCVEPAGNAPRDRDDTEGHPCRTMAWDQAVAGIPTAALLHVNDYDFIF